MGIGGRQRLCPGEDCGTHVLDGGGGQKAGVLGQLRPRVRRQWASLRRADFQEKAGILHYRVFDVEIQIFHRLLIKAARPAWAVSLPAGGRSRKVGPKKAQGTH